MSDNFLAEIKIFAGNFAPLGWALCNGQLLPISQNTALFSLLGTTYGGDGKTNFALPDLQGRAPVHAGQGTQLTNRLLGESAGSAAGTLLQSEMPAHTHGGQGNSNAGNKTTPVNNVWSALGGTRTPPPLYSATQNTQMNPLALSVTGGGLPHNNMSPYLCLTFIIALQGIFPPR